MCKIRLSYTKTDVYSKESISLYGRKVAAKRWLMRDPRLAWPKHSFSVSHSQVSEKQTFSIRLPIFAGLSLTIAPAFSSAATLSAAAPFPPEMMAPA